MKNKKVYKFLSCMVASLFLCSFAAGCSCAGEQSSSTETETESNTNFSVAKDGDGKAIMLTDNGKSEYKIVVPVDADAYELFAAQELQDFLLKSTGATLSIITDEGISYDNTKKYVSVGATALNTLTLTEEEYGASGGIVDVDGQLVLLSGAEGYGTINAAYQFMHYQIGWEAYASNEIYYETKESVSLLNFQDHKYIPFSDYRCPLAKNLFGPSNLKAAARMGFTAGSYSGGTTFDGALFADYLSNLPNKIVLTSDPAVEADWFSGGNLCLSRDNIIRYVTEKVKELILKTPKAKYLNLGNGDNHSCCECDSCKEALKTCGTQGGISIQFMNKIVDNLKKDGFFEANPQVNANMKFMFLNYHAYVEAPVDEEGNVLVKANENVGAYVCPIDACFGHALDDPNCEINQKHLKNMQNWTRVTDTIGVYLYECNFKNHFTYYNNWATFQTWGKYFEEIDVEYFYAHSVYNESSPLESLRQYLKSKYLTTPDCADFETLTSNFMKHYYKGASEEMYAYYQAIRQHTTAMQYTAGSSCVNCFDEGTGISYSAEKWWSLPTIERLLDILDKAYEALESSQYTEEKKSEYYKRILIEEATLRYYRYSFHVTTYTDDALQEEKEFLRAAFALLGFGMISEFGELVI